MCSMIDYHNCNCAVVIHHGLFLMPVLLILSELSSETSRTVIAGTKYWSKQVTTVMVNELSHSLLDLDF